MTTHTSTNRIHNVLNIFTACLLLFGGSLMAQDAASVGTAQFNTTSATMTALRPVRFEQGGQREFDQQDTTGLPLPREDMILPQSAVSVGGVNPTAEQQLKISARFSDTKMLGFLGHTTMQQLATTYLESARMIDARHVSPPSYEERTRGAIQTVINALDNETFLRNAGAASVRMDQVRPVQEELGRMIQSQPTRNANEAVGVMQSAAELVSRRLGIRREAVGLEFLNGTIDSLDKYSAFMPEASSRTPGAELDTVKTAGLEEQIVGIGVELMAHDRGVELVGVIDNSPAQELGLKEGDVIIAVNMQSVEGRSLNEIANLMGGQSGTSVTLDILRDGKKYRGTAVRRQVYVSSITGTKIIDQQTMTGYIRMKQFSESSKEDLEKALWTLYRQGMKNLVLDLRGNPGGLLDECIDVSNLFLPSGTIVSTRGRNSSDNTQSSATFDKTWATPLVVLVDENSASASEIFAAAVQENRRGIIVGRNSYGKGTVQTHFPMQTVSAVLKLTTAKFYSPNGREMAGAGVTPDVPVQAPSENYRGTDNDADVQAALNLIRNGDPARMLGR